MEQSNSSAEDANVASEPGVWRDEIQARVAGYRTRRGRRIEGAFSMRFPFPTSESPNAPEAESPIADVVESDAAANSESSATEQQQLTSSSTAPVEAASSWAETGATIVDANEAAADEPFAFTPPPPPPPRPKRKVIAFPRPVIAELTYQPQEPLVPEQPRILEVPEELRNLPTTPLLDGLRFASHQQSEAAIADHVELPLQPVTISQRLYAGLVDCALAGAAAGLFLAACYKLMPRLPLTKPLLLIVAAIPLLLWAVYQYLFLMYGGRTVGMRVAHLRLSSFKGNVPRRRQRRKRVLGLYFSTASLMMGLLWALVDVDALCWHDRISGTYLIAEGSN